MVIILILWLVQGLLANDEFRYSKTSDLLKTYACLEETNVTYISYKWDDNFFGADSLTNLLTTLKEPCTKISFFDHNLRKVVQWKGQQSKIGFSNYFDDKEFEVFIETLCDENFENPHTTKILLINRLADREILTNNRINEKIGLLEKNTKWNVILICHFTNCPMLPHLPIHRIVPVNNYEYMKKKVKDLVRNPDFNKFEFLKYNKIDNQNLTCLENKTIHFYDVHYECLDLLERIALIKYSIQGLITSKFVIYPNMYEDYLTYLLKQYGLDSTVIVGNDTFPTVAGDGIFFLYTNDVEDKMTIENFPANSRNSVVVYDINRDKYGIKSAKSLYSNRARILNKTVQRFSTKLYDSAMEFYEDFIDVLLNVSCF